jgi:hypothetical protein
MGRVIAMRAFVLVSAGLFAAAARPTQAAEVKISDFSIIPIHEGINTVDRFTADGRTATIIKAWRDSSNAHGHTLYLASVHCRDTDIRQKISAAGLRPPARARASRKS